MQNQDRSKEFDQLLQRRDALLEELSNCSSDLQDRTKPYGSHDPHQVALAICDTCGSIPELVTIGSPKKSIRWGARCPRCEKAVIPPQKHQWLAALEWNCINLGTQRYQDLPMFQLTNLNRHQAGDKIGAVRKHITARLQLCATNRSIAVHTKSRYQPGKLYRLRLDAYLKWAMLAHRLIKVEQRAGASRS